MFKRLFLAISLIFIAFSVLSGSAIWTILGLSEDLHIQGEAPVVREVGADTGSTWESYGGDKGGSRFSSQTRVHAGNVSKLSIAWTHQSGTFEEREHVRNRTALETTPILVGSSLVYCTQFNEVIALEPGTGQQKWKFDPEVALDLDPANRYTCRGVSHWADNAQSPANHCSSRLFMGTVDSRLIALDTTTGQLCEDFGDKGQVRVNPSLKPRWPGEVQITSAPAIAGDLVITGSAIGDNLRTLAPLGTVHAYDARTGERRWSFNPIPQNPEDPAFSSWADNSALRTGHANVWSTISVDEKRGLVFLPTSSPSPDYYGGNRVGDNRYANSIVALDVQTGAVKWHFQTVHHDIWDYDLPAQPGLYSVWREGQSHDVVAVATKTGLIFVLDRDSGEPFLPIEETPVPQRAENGERLSITQPFPGITPPLVPNTLDSDNAFGLTHWDKLDCKEQIEALNAEGLFTPPTLRGTLAYPFSGGGTNWGSTAYDPSRNLLVVNMSNIAQYVKLQAKTGNEPLWGRTVDGAEFAPMEGAPYTMTRAPLLSPLGLPCSPPPWGILAAVDLDSGKIVWRKTLGTTEDIAPGGLAFKFGTPNFGGPMITASGLVFIGATMDDYLRAFDVATGEELWKGRLPAGGQATPMTYSYEGRQFVVIAAGGHAPSGTKLGDSIVAFALKTN